MQQREAPNAHPSVVEPDEHSATLEAIVKLAKAVHQNDLQERAVLECAEDAPLEMAATTENETSAGLQ